MSIYYLPTTTMQTVGAEDAEDAEGISDSEICSSCPPRWIPGVTAIVGGFMGSIIGRTRIHHSMSRQGMYTLLGGVLGLGAAYIIRWPSFLG